MIECFYQNRALEAAMYHQLYLDTSGQPNTAMVERRIEEAGAIAKNRRGTLFALAWELTNFSLERGYPVSFRGSAGALLVSYLLGFAQNNPMDLNIPWQSAFPVNGRSPHLTLNVAPELYETARRYLKALVTDCDVRWDVPGLPPYRVVFVPDHYKWQSSHDPDNYKPEIFEYLTMDIRPHELMSYLGQEAKKAGEIPERGEVLSPEFIQKVWEEDMWYTPILQDLGPLRDVAPELEPTCFDHLIRLLGLMLAPPARLEELNKPGVTLDNMIVTREDLYESLLRDGVPKEDALRRMRKARDLYSRAMCAEYLTYALTLAWFRERRL